MLDPWSSVRSPRSSRRRRGESISQTVCSGFRQSQAKAAWMKIRVVRRTTTLFEIRGNASSHRRHADIVAPCRCTIVLVQVASSRFTPNPTPGLLALPPANVRFCSTQGSRNDGNTLYRRTRVVAPCLHDRYQRTNPLSRPGDILGHRLLG